MKLPLLILILFAFTLGAHGAIFEFTGSGGITINDDANATPYPSLCNVSGISGTVAAVRVKITGFTHTYPADAAVFLVAPSGQAAAVFSDAGGGSDVSNINLVFDDSADAVIPAYAAITAGTYRPANYGTARGSLPASETGTIVPNLNMLGTGPVNGTWKLYVSDMEPPDAGSIVSWSLVIETAAEERIYHTSTLLHDGKVLVAGGSASGSAVGSTALYDPATRIFRGTGNLVTARKLHTATLLPNGKVLVVGGNQNGAPFASAELYDPASGTWSATGSLNLARLQHTATLLPNGKVLVAGGVNGATYLSSAELYDPNTGMWTGAGNFVDGRNSHTATLLANGKVLIAGGYAGGAGYPQSAHLYDPVANTWTPTGSLTSFRSYHTATLLPTGKVLVAGGSNGTYPPAAQLYDPVPGTWSPTGTLLNPRNQHTATLLPNGKVLIAGGFNAGTLAAQELYDPSSGGWTAAVPLPAPRSNHTATLLPNAKVLMVGGIGGSGLLTSAEIAVFGTGSWSTTGSLPAPLGSFPATLLPNGKVLAAGGNGSSGTATATAALYDPATPAWTVTGSLAAARRNQSVTLLPNGKVLAAGGANGANYLATVELYDAAAGTWTATGNLKNARYSHTATVLLSGKVLVAGGFNGNANGAGYLHSAELYNPATGAWSATGDLAYARHSHTATLLPGGQVLIVGGTAEGSALANADLYNPISGTWSATGRLNTARYDHTATLLPGGKVLVAGGRGAGYLSSAEIYDPGTGTWSFTTTNLSSARQSHTATLLPNGIVLVAGGRNASPSLASTELYDPATGLWSAGATLTAARELHAAVLLPSGKVLVAGYLSSSELYDPGLGFSDAWRPQIASAAFDAAGRLVLTGTGFRGISGASGGNGTQDSPTNFPLVQLRQRESERTIFLAPDPSAAVSATSFTSVPVTPSADYFTATVMANAIPSTAFFVAFPDVAVLQPAGVIVANGGASDFPTLLGTPVSLTFTIANTGGVNLTGLTITKDGANAADFTITADPTAPVLPGRTTTFTIQFVSATSGAKSASLHLTTNVAGKNPYNLNLTGHALSFTEDSDGDGMNDASEFQLRDLGFKWDVGIGSAEEAKQLGLVATYYANANGAGLYTPAQVQTLNVGTPLIARNPATGQAKLTIGVKKSTDLATFFSLPLTSGTTAINGAGELEFTFPAPDNAAFFRLESR